MSRRLEHRELFVGGKASRSRWLRLASAGFASLRLGGPAWPSSFRTGAAQGVDCATAVESVHSSSQQLVTSPVLPTAESDLPNIKKNKIKRRSHKWVSNNATYT